MSAVLGFNAYIHDTAAALVSGGRLAAFAEEERFNREKHTTAFPADSIAYVLRHSGLSMDDVEDVAFYWDPWCGLTRRLGQTLRRLPGSLRPLLNMQWGNFSKIRKTESYFRSRYGYRGRFHFVNHYLSHAAGAFYPSPFDEAMILIVDGNGEIATTWFGVGEGTTIRPLGEIYYPHSLGLIYCTVTEYLGFRQNCDEGKVMGLSAYGGDRFLPAFRRLVRYKGDGRFDVDLSYFDYHTHRRNWFSPKFAGAFGPPRRPGEPLTQHHKDVAYACQAVLEETVMSMVRDLAAKTGKRKLVFSGGVALNCVLNGKLLRSGLIDGLYVPPPAYDAGTAWGAALHVHHRRVPEGGRDRSPGLFTGPSYSEDEMKSALRESQLSHSTPDRLAAVVAELLAKGLIVARFDGRMEMGPRALGHRSILADPRPEDMKDRLNKQVKHRETFRPFAPSVLAERCEELFESGGSLSPAMLNAFKVKAQWAGRIPAVCHVDGTARVQTVDEGSDPAYHELISAFHERTGVPCVLNTSFNVMGQPIVNTPREAVDCFRSTGIDALVMGKTLTVKD